MSSDHDKRPKISAAASDALAALEALTEAGDSLARLDAGRELRERAEQLELDLVRAARKDGLSWAKIGGLYGLTKQGAQQRFRPGGAPSKKKSAPAAPAD